VRLKALHALYEFLKKKLRENKQEAVFFQTEMPLVQVLSAMESGGIKIEGIWVDIGKDDFGAGIPNRVCRGDEAWGA